MHRTSERPVIARSLVNAILASTRTLPGTPVLYPPTRVHLFKSPLTITPDTTRAEFDAVECDYTGYSFIAQGPVGNQFRVNQNVQALNEWWDVFSLGSDPTVFNTIYGYYVTGEADDSWYFAEQFAVPVEFAFPLDFMDFSLLFMLSCRPNG